MTNSNRFQFITNAILVALLSIMVCSCSNDDDRTPIKKEEPIAVITEISEEIKDLIYFNGDEKAPTVLITIPGGPSTEFSPDIVNLIATNFNTTDILTVNVHQAQTLDSTIVKDNDITLDQAVGFNSESVEALDKVISYFKDQNRTVYILGFSFGAFITQELIAQKGIDSADKYLIMTGRLDINEAIWKGALEGKESFFENGVTPIVKAEPDQDVTERNLNRLFAGLAKNRYSQLFSSIGDLDNVTYVYGATDEALGSLTDEEIQFLESKNTNIIAGSGNHGDTFLEFIEQGFNDAFGIELLP